MKFTSKSIEIVFAYAFISDTKRILYCAAILGVNDKQKQRKHCDEGEDGRAGSGWKKGQSRALARATINVLTHSLLKAVDAIVGVGHGVSLSSESVASST